MSTESDGHHNGEQDVPRYIATMVISSWWHLGLLLWPWSVAIVGVTCKQRAEWLSSQQFCTWLCDKRWHRKFED
eukprot:2425530-Amphidinium_carterae.1